MADVNPASENTVGYLQLIRQNRLFRYLWSAQIVSLLGDWFNLIASATLIAQLTSSGAAIGGLFVIRMLAPFLISPFAGVIADRYNRKHIVMVTDISRGLIVLCFVLVQEPEHVWLVYVLTAFQSTLQGIFFPAWNSILPDITTPEELGAANALSAATWSVMLAFGAAVGGIFSGIVGVYPAFVVDAITFFVGVFILSRMPYKSLLAESTDKSLKAGLQQYIEGLNYLRRHFDILMIALHKGVVGLLIVGAFQVIQVTIAERYFPIGDDGSVSLGLIYLIVGIGTGLGPLVGRYWAKDQDRQLRIVILFGYVASLFGFLIVSTLASFPVVLIGSFLRGIGGGVIWVLGTQLLLQILPNEVRGRVFSTEFALYALLSAVASGSVGVAIDTSLGLSNILVFISALTIIPIILWSLWIVFGKRDTIVVDEQPALAQ